MSEFGARTAFVGISMLGAAILAAGCNASTEPHRAITPSAVEDEIATPHIPRCETSPPPQIKTPVLPSYPQEKPLPTNASLEQTKVYDQKRQAAQSKINSEQTAVLNSIYPPVMRIPVIHGIAEHDPLRPSQRVIDDTTKALVEISSEGLEDGWKGSGFVTEDERGQKVVVTAAHVVGALTMKQLTISSATGIHIHPTGGCYIYSNPGKLITLPASPLEGPDSAGPYIDLAILTIPQNTALSTLQLSSQKPKAGSWLNYVNYQGNYGPKHSLVPRDSINYPATYSGIIAPESVMDADFDVITGTQELGQNVLKYFDSTHAISGESGGPVEATNGRVVGVSIDGDRGDGNNDNSYETNDDLKSAFDISFLGVTFGSQSGFEPTFSQVEPASVIIEALRSPALKS